MTTVFSQDEIDAVFPTVSATMADALGCDVEDIKPNVSLIEGLDAESIDFLDMVFRLERAFKIKIPRGKIVENARGARTEAEFEQPGLATDGGLYVPESLPVFSRQEIARVAAIPSIPGITMSIKKGFNTRAGETRNGTHFTMKGVTRNTLDLKIASADTDGGMAVRVHTRDLSVIGRNTQGYRFLRLEEGDKLSIIAPVVAEEDAGESKDPV